MKIGIFLGSIRKGRAGEAIARWVSDAAEKRDGFEYERLDLSEFNVPLLDAEMVPGAANKQYEDEATTAWSKAVDACDAFIFVTPEYNHSLAPALANALSYLNAEWANKAAGIVGYGSAMGVRATEHLRAILSELQVAHVQKHGMFSLFTDFKDFAEFQPTELQAASVDPMFDQLLSWTEAMKTVRQG